MTDVDGQVIAADASVGVRQRRLAVKGISYLDEATASTYLKNGNI